MAGGNMESQKGVQSLRDVSGLKTLECYAISGKAHHRRDFRNDQDLRAKFVSKTPYICSWQGTTWHEVFSMSCR